MAGAVVKVEILGDAASALKAFGKVDKESRSMGEKMGATGRTMSRNVTLPVLAAGGALLGMAVKTGEAADRFLDLNAITGVSTTKLQEMAQVAKEAGVGSEFYSNAVIEVTKAGDMLVKGTGPQAEAFEMLGISVMDAGGNLRSAETLTDEAMQALAAIEDPTLRAARAQDIFGRKFEDLLPVLALGADGIAAAQQEAHDLGAVMSEEALQDANEFRQGMENLKASVGGLVAGIGSGLAPVLTEVTEFMVANVIPTVRSIFQAFKDLPGPVKKIMTVLVGLAATIGPVLVVGAKLVKGFQAIGTAFKVLSAIVSANPWVLLIAATIALVVVIVKNWDKIKAALAKAWDGIKRGASAVWTFIRDNWDKLIGFFRGIPGRMVGALSGMWNGITSGFKAAINTIIKWWNDLSFTMGGQTIDLGFMHQTIPSFTISTPNLPYLAKGGVIGKSGMAIVGERGPEPVFLPRGAEVLPNSAMGAAMASGGGRPIHIVLEVDGAAIAEALINYEDGIG